MGHVFNSRTSESSKWSPDGRVWVSPQTRPHRLRAWATRAVSEVLRGSLLSGRKVSEQSHPGPVGVRSEGSSSLCSLPPPRASAASLEGSLQRPNQAGSNHKRQRREDTWCVGNGGARAGKEVALPCEHHGDRPRGQAQAGHPSSRRPSVPTPGAGLWHSPAPTGRTHSCTARHVGLGFPPVGLFLLTSLRSRRAASKV